MFLLQSAGSLESEFKFSTSLKENSTLNKRTNVLVISYSNIDSLHDILAHCLIQFPFQTRKGIDFYYWCIVLYMHKFGYIYLTEGRKLAVALLLINHDIVHHLNKLIPLLLI